MRTHSPEAAQVFKKLWNIRQLTSLIATPPLVYLAIVILGLNGAEAKVIVTYVVPPVALGLSLAAPFLIVKALTNRAFDESAPPLIRLERLLKIPQQLNLIQLGTVVPGVGAVAGVSVLLFGRTPWIVVWAVVVLGLQIALMEIIETNLAERMLKPYTVKAFHDAQGTMPNGGGITWPRQVWYLPYSFSLFVAATLATTLTIIGRQGYDAYQFLMEQSGKVSAGEAHRMLEQSLTKLASDSVVPVSVLGTYLLLVAAGAAWLLARRLKEGAQSVQEALVGLAQGNPKRPEWTSTDEIGDLSAATTRVFEQLRSLSLSLKDSALALRHSAGQLGASTLKQSEALAIQTASLQETQVTAEEIKYTSQVAAQKSSSILTQAERADEISRTGEAAIQEGLAGIEEIGAQVREMSARIKSLDEQARQIARITAMVKDLADQSNMLALNAAIEAVRSGESGKGFGVVAREIRTLADQSIRATHSIRTLLQNISGAIATTTSLTDKGSQRVEASLQQIRNFSQQIQQLSAIVRDNASSVRQITAAVTQQDAGIVQITQAVGDLTRVMDQTMAQLRSSEEAMSVVNQVADKVTEIVGQYGWTEAGAQLAGNEAPQSESR